MPDLSQPEHAKKEIISGVRESQPDIFPPRKLSPLETAKLIKQTAFDDQDILVGGFIIKNFVEDAGNVPLIPMPRRLSVFPYKVRTSPRALK